MAFMSGKIKVSGDMSFAMKLGSTMRLIHKQDLHAVPWRKGS